MNNVLLDPLPGEWNGYRIDPSFQIGVQITQILSDTELSEYERLTECVELLYIDIPDNIEEAMQGLGWFLNGWNHDNVGKKDKKENKNYVDFDIDQWRIYSAFYAQYGIDLNDIEIHWWQFMGMLTCLQECAYTRVIDVRMRKTDGKMSLSEKKQLEEAKRIYAIRNEETIEEMSLEERERYDSFMQFAKINKKGD